eukprot:2878185-Pleurochrysis_carterae.AAC.3
MRGRCEEDAARVAGRADGSVGAVHGEERRGGSVAERISTKAALEVLLEFRVAGVRCERGVGVSNLRGSSLGCLLRLIGMVTMSVPRSRGRSRRLFGGDYARACGA